MRFWVKAIGLALWLLPAWAASLPGDLDARRLMQDSERRLQQQLDARRQMPGGAGEAPLAPAAQADTRCLPIRSLRISGVVLLDSADRAALPPLPTDCLSAQSIDELVRALTARYVAHGYIAVRVHVQPVDAQGTVELRVEEGRVEAIRHPDGSAVPGNLFPGVTGRPLNLRDIEQGLDQANRLASSQATVAIAPGESTGGSVLVLSDSEQPVPHALLSFDNTGSDSTGRLLATGNLALDNPSGHFDFLSLNAQASLDDTATHHSSNGAFLYQLPLGYRTLTFNHAQSDYLNTLVIAGQVIPLSGETLQSSARLDQVISRDQQQIGSLYGSLTHKQVRNRFMGEVQQLSSPTLTLATLGYNRLQLLPQGNVTLDLSLTRGLRWFGADSAAERQNDALPDPQFSRLNLSLGSVQQFGPWQWQSALQGQASREPLPAIEQLELADNGAVRGYRHNSLAGETGWVWRNTWSWRTRVQDIAWLPHLGVDVGREFPRDGVTPWQTVMGMSVGLAVAWHALSLDIEYSRPLKAPAGFAPEPKQVLARLIWQCW
ncbi:ShlB/FhaC/HecB family hemolysin secretion/activation protein [Paludibacterium purpuratum]|uniref:Hemolysin activation/secretion protein n=1 Tax=Paludibacterium purpuratum TaxID=1144873 RepID=A0A4R7BD95_9NEIS|nr:ShlB/FhaC/HecB family hemolysin secretion/activation protein [Paludibacterium purpuratum]TDR81617.1 hemolysin activation/secretion protein [Paludibacterium purpuratum]